LFVTNRAAPHGKTARPVSSSTSSFVEAAECLGLVAVVGFFYEEEEKEKEKERAGRRVFDNQRLL
jgi:hypothetical protein